MNVAAFTQLVERDHGSYVDMLDDVEFVEPAQDAVDDRRSDSGYPSICFRDEVVVGWVTIVIENDRDHGAQGHCRAAAGSSNGVVDQFLLGFGDPSTDHEVGSIRRTRS